MSEDIFLTQAGYDKLKEELDYLIKVRRRDITQQVREARLKGDLKENAEYDAAKEAQASLESKISELEFKLSNARIIEREGIAKDKVYIGATVTLLDLDTDAKEVYILVSKEEADYSQGKISIESPIGKAILGKKIDDIVSVRAPVGELKYKIIDIQRL
ncbi:MAG: transcription elongation factor GreA [Candidatus Omnitrophica bacterium]|nr:transcription elongation factor GreA [Candidatus Omnitrophota bacterium]MDD5351911.1 transcription elongation factor GreA [Candidatus Omnitrophota bacterium]MDD5550737.1 transcription elongation factor GreA [Candidatus Omnitrophota bacterium]